MKREPIAKIGQFGLHVIQTPSGKWIYVGSVPVNLCEEYTDKLGFRQLRSRSFDTEQEAIDFYNTPKTV